jgi:tetratricopeptide (TPR) repeat protein
MTSPGRGFARVPVFVVALFVALAANAAGPSETFRQAEELYLKGDLELAGLFFQKEIKDNPTNAAAYFYLANISREKGRLVTALSNLIAAVRLDPENPRFQFNLGNAFYDTGAYAEAIAAYKRCLSLETRSPNPAAHLNLGMAHLRTRDVPSTIAAWEEFLRAAPAHPQVENVRRALAILRRSDYRPPEPGTSSTNMGLPALPKFDWDTEALKKKDRFHRDDDRGMKEDDRTADIQE